MHALTSGALGPYGPGKCDDKPFLHKHNATYYLSWGGFYATASHPYGPYQVGTPIRANGLVQMLSGCANVLRFAKS